MYEVDGPNSKCLLRSSIAHMQDCGSISQVNKKVEFSLLNAHL